MRREPPLDILHLAAHCHNVPVTSALVLMATFELQMRFKPNGEFAAAWFDDAKRMWDDERLARPGPLRKAWVAPRLQLHNPRQGATAVLFNPNAIAVAERVRDELAAFPELEFLPIEVDGHGTFFIMHVLAAIELPLGAKARCAPSPSGNLVELHAFPPEYRPADAFFKVLHPPGSAARSTGAVTRATYASRLGREAIDRVAGPFLEVLPR